MKYSKIIILIICLVYMVGCKEKGDMPYFSIRLKDSTSIITSDQIPTGRPVMFIYFDPDCDDCQQQTAEMLANINKFKNIRLYFITVSDLDRMKVFYKYYHLSDYPDVILGQDFNFSLLKNYQLPTTPCVLIYNKHKALRAILKGYFPVKKIIEQVNSI